MSSSQEFRIATLNLWQRYGEWPARRTVLAETFAEMRPDVVAFQESIKTPDYDQASEILCSEFALVHSRTRSADGMGISIASRWGIQELQEIDLDVSPRTAGFPCSALVAKINAPPPIGPFLFVNHFPNFQLNLEYERELQAVAVARALEERAAARDEQVIVAGDMDADPGAASIRFWTGRQSLGGISVCYRDAWESANGSDGGPTFTPENSLVRDQVIKGMRPFRDWPFRRIDYVFVRLGAHGGTAFDIVRCRRTFEHPVSGTWASDHFGLVVDLRRPEMPSLMPGSRV